MDNDMRVHLEAPNDQDNHSGVTHMSKAGVDYIQGMEKGTAGMRSGTSPILITI